MVWRDIKITIGQCTNTLKEIRDDFYDCFKLVKLNCSCKAVEFIIFYFDAHDQQPCFNTET